MPIYSMPICNNAICRLLCVYRENVQRESDDTFSLEFFDYDVAEMVARLLMDATKS